MPTQEKTSFFRAAHADELIVNEVGRHPDEGETAPPLADDLVPGREWNEMGEPLHGNRIAVPEGLFHGFGKTEETRHASQLTGTIVAAQSLAYLQNGSIPVPITWT